MKKHISEMTAEDKAAFLAATRVALWSNGDEDHAG